MSWSTSGSGQFGYLEEIHRIGLVIDVNGERDQTAASVGSGSSLEAVYDAGFRHFVFRIKRQRKAKGFFFTRNLVNDLALLKEKSRTRNSLQDSPLYITMYCDNVDTMFIKELFTAISGQSEGSLIDVDCLVLDFHSLLAQAPLSSFSTSSFEASIVKVAELSALILSIRKVVLACKADKFGGAAAESTTSAQSPSIKLGIDGIFDRGILQLLFEQPVGAFLQVVVPGSVQLPNIRTRVTDFVHSRSANILLVLANDTILSTPTSAEFGPVLYPLIQKYPQSKAHVAPVLVKCLLQCGLVVAINISTGVPFILEMLAPLLSPFVNRKEFVAPSITKRFVVSLEDVEALLQSSEEEEAKEEEWWRKATLHSVKPRTLTDAIPDQP